MPIAVIAVTRPGPKTAPSMMAESSAGNANVKSLARITRASTQPRVVAASRPSVMPRPMPMPTAISPTATALRLPASNSEKMSRPRLSVPSQCAGEGGCNLFGMSSSAGA